MAASMPAAASAVSWPAAPAIARCPQVPPPPSHADVRSRSASSSAGRAAAAAIGVLLTASAQAQWDATLSVESDDRYRGVSRSDSRPDIRLTLNHDASGHWYAGGSLSRAALDADRFHPQLIAYGGWLGPRIEGRTVEVGMSATGFAGVSGYDYAEVYAGVLAERWSSRLYYAPNYYGQRVQVAYLEFDSHWPLERDARLFAHVGALVPLAGARGSADKRRLDAMVGAGIVVARWDLHVAATSVTPGGPYPAVFSGRRTALAVGASFAF
jgi:uncharacterized protein (TIGR02001 family)